MTHRARQLLIAITACVLVTGAVVAIAPPRVASAWSHSPIRLFGADRYATSVALSQTVFPDGASTVFIASGETFPDALAGAAAAGVNRAPLLLTAQSSLPPSVSAELQRLHPNSIVVLGGVAAVSDTTVGQIHDATGITPLRVAGATRYDTAAGLAAFYPTGKRVFVATGANFADGLAGGSAAAVSGGPLLLVQPNSVPVATSEQLQRLQPAEIVVLGGSAAVSDFVVSTLLGYTPNVRRVAGADRYATAAEVANEFFPAPSEVLLASGVNFPDALSAGSVGATLGDPLLLTIPACLPPATTSLLQAKTWPSITVIGGGDAVSEDAARANPCSPVPDGPLGPGVRLDTMVTDGPNVVRVIELDRAQGLAVRSTTATGRIVGRLPTTEIARRWNAVVAVNGDFFLGDGQPSHAFATGGRMLKAPALVEDAIGFNAEDPRSSYTGTPQLSMTAEVQETAAKTAIDRVNDGAPDSDQIALFTPEGAEAGAPPAGVCAAHLTPVEAPQLDGEGDASQLHVVTSASCASGPPAVSDDDVLVTPAGGSRAAFVSALTAGQHVAIGWSVNPHWTNLLDSTGSNTTLVHAGVPSDDVVFGSGAFYDAVAPRTAVGRLADGRDVLVTVDGRQPGYSVGMTPMEFAQFLTSIGVVEAANLDGGGSTTLAVNGVLVNRPSDQAGERAVGTALVVVPQGTLDPPPFAGGGGAPLPEPDPFVARDPASLGGWSATLAARGLPLRPELAATARLFAAADGTPP